MSYLKKNHMPFPFTFIKGLGFFYWIIDQLLGLEIYIKDCLCFHCKGLFGK